MTIGPDIAEALEEVGLAFTILRDTGNVEGEYLDITPPTQVGRPFMREFFSEIMLSYETVVISGDVIELDTSGEHFLLMNKTPDMFENEVIKYDGILYKANVSGELFRPSGQADWSSSTYHKTEIFNSIKSNCYATLVPSTGGGQIDTEEAIGLISIEKQELYIPSSIGVKLLDRYQSRSGEYYRVESVIKRRYPNIDLAILGEDTRQS